MKKVQEITANILIHEEEVEYLQDKYQLISDEIEKHRSETNRQLEYLISEKISTINEHHQLKVKLGKLKDELKEIETQGKHE